MADPTFSLRGWVARSLTAARKMIETDSSDPSGPRMSRYGEQYGVVPVVGEPALADEGSLVIASMLPAATALQLGLSAAFSATAAAIVVANQAPAGPQSPRITLRDIHLVQSVAPTSGTGLAYATVLDNINRAPTTVSGDGSPGTPATVTAYRAAANVTNMDESNAPVGRAWFPLSIAAGAPPTVPAPSQNARTMVGNGSLRAQIPVVGDDYRIVFGATDRPGGQLVTAAPAGASRIVESHPAVVIGPQQYFLLYLWSPSNITAGNAWSQIDVSWFER